MAKLSFVAMDTFIYLACGEIMALVALFTLDIIGDIYPRFGGGGTLTEVFSLTPNILCLNPPYHANKILYTLVNTI